MFIPNRRFYIHVKIKICKTNAFFKKCFKNNSEKWFLKTVFKNGSLTFYKTKVYLKT